VSYKLRNSWLRNTLNLLVTLSRLRGERDSIFPTNIMTSLETMLQTTIEKKL